MSVMSDCPGKVNKAAGRNVESSAAADCWGGRDVRDVEEHKGLTV